MCLDLVMGITMVREIGWMLEEGTCIAIPRLFIVLSHQNVWVGGQQMLGCALEVSVSITVNKANITYTWCL